MSTAWRWTDMRINPRTTGGRPRGMDVGISADDWRTISGRFGPRIPSRTQAVSGPARRHLLSCSPARSVRRSAVQSPLAGAHPQAPYTAPICGDAQRYLSALAASCSESPCRFRVSIARRRRAAGWSDGGTHAHPRAARRAVTDWGTRRLPRDADHRQGLRPRTQGRLPSDGNQTPCGEHIGGRRGNAFPRLWLGAARRPVVAGGASLAEVGSAYRRYIGGRRENTFPRRASSIAELVSQKQGLCQARWTVGE